MFCPCRGQKQLLNDAVSVTQSLAILYMVSIKICPSFQQGMFYVWIIKRNILKAFGLLVFEHKDCWEKIICRWLNILLPTYGSLVFLQFFSSLSFLCYLCHHFRSHWAFHENRASLHDKGIAICKDQKF